MAHIKRDKKHEVVKPSDDCSCSSSDSSSSSPSSSSSTDCSERKYGEHCEMKRLPDSKTYCRRKCRTICVVECHKEVHQRYDWCYKTKEDKKWREIEGEKLPKKCDEDDHHGKKPDDKKHVVKK